MDWKDRKVLVTGANGFVGSHLVEKLVDLGADVTCFVRSTSGNNHRNIENVWGEITLFRGDLQDKHSVKQGLKHLKGHPDSVIFHLGAQAHVGQSWDRPYETVKTNTIGTLNILQSIVDLDLGLHKLDVAGTSEQYGNKDENKIGKYREDEEGLKLDEEAPINPTSIYATSKVAADFLARNYNDAYGVPSVTTRMFNNYGPRQDPRYITGTIISQALKREKVELGNLQPKRDMCFVSDGVRGHLDVAAEGEPGDVYTYGYGDNVSMREWAEKILKIGRKNGYWSNKVEIVQDQDRYRPGDSDVQELRVDYSKINNLTGWEPEVGWSEGIRRTIKWYSENEADWINRVDWR